MSADVRTTLCDSCRQPIIFATTSRGKAMPVDVEPSSNGNVLLSPWHGAMLAGVLGPAQANAARRGGKALHLSHFATCSDAPAWRRR